MFESVHLRNLPLSVQDFDFFCLVGKPSSKFLSSPKRYLSCRTHDYINYDLHTRKLICSLKVSWRCTNIIFCHQNCAQMKSMALTEHHRRMINYIDGASEKRLFTVSLYCNDCIIILTFIIKMTYHGSTFINSHKCQIVLQRLFFKV